MKTLPLEFIVMLPFPIMLYATINFRPREGVEQHVHLLDVSGIIHSSDDLGL